MQFRRFSLPTLGATGALTLVALTAGSASAHVEVSPDTTAAGSYAVLTFSVGHGCEGSPTTRLAIQMPEEIPQVTPTVDPAWEVEKVTEALAEPIADAHGNEITERVAQVVYTSRTPLADGFRDTVELSVQLPDAAGETLAFPVVQSCRQGETRWTETAAEGQDPEELASPAPVLTLSEATDEDHGSAGHDEDAGKQSAEQTAEDSAGGSTGLAVGGLVAGVLGAALGGLALARSGTKA